MKLILAFLLIAPSAFAGTFSLDLDGKSFTCTEGGSSASGCDCREVPHNNNYLSVGLYKKGENDTEKYLWQSSYEYNPSRDRVVTMLRDCAQQKKNQFADLCSQ